MWGEVRFGGGQCAEDDPQDEGECFGVRLSRGPVVPRPRKRVGR